MPPGQRKCSQSQVLDISWFGKERTQKESENIGNKAGKLQHNSSRKPKED